MIFQQALKAGVLWLTIIIYLSIWIFNSELAFSDENPLSIQDVFGAGGTKREKWAEFQSYIPQEREYFFNIGAMWEKRNMYWLGGEVGFYFGPCLWKNSPSCHNYFDILGGVGGADGMTTGLVLASWRWQWIRFPSPFSPSLRVFMGVLHLHDSHRNNEVLTGGMGYGMTVSLHKNMDFKLEARSGYGFDQHIWTQVFIALGLKLDNWVESFHLFHFK